MEYTTKLKVLSIAGLISTVQYDNLNYMKDSFGTESHARELDIIYGIQPADFKEE